MKRFPGVTFSAVVLLLGSLLQLLLALGTGAAAAFEKYRAGSAAQQGAGALPLIPSWIPVFLYVLCGFFGALALWGILTSAGLFRLHRWARHSVLVIGGCLAVMGLPSLLISAVMLFVPLPLPAAVDPAHAQTAHLAARIGFGAIAIIYGLMAVVGVSWLIYFNLKKVRALFAGILAQLPGQIPGQLPATAAAERPLLISVIAVLSIFGAAVCLLLTLLPIPAATFGLILYGWQKTAVLLVYSVLLAVAGLGLWRLEEWARRLTIAIQVLGLAQYIVFLARPSLMTRYAEEINRALRIPQPLQQPAQFQSIMYICSFGLGILLLVAVIGILHYYRAAFRIPLRQTQSPGLP